MRLTAEDRHCNLSLGVSFADGSPWPACLDFGGTPVMADGREELAFAIDCGARVPFSLSGGAVAYLKVERKLDPPEVVNVAIDAQAAYPRELTVGDVTVHLDSLRSGWLCRIADVTVDGSNLSHLYPDATANVTASITNCHADAYIGCTWLGGVGITFSDSHSLTTGVTYASYDPVAWATNAVSLVTYYQGGQCATNTEFISVGTQSEPTPELLLSCSPVQFLNDDAGGNRTERVYRVEVSLCAMHGTSGSALLSVQGNTGTSLYWEDGVTPYSGANAITLSVPDDVYYSPSSVFYMTSTNIGHGILSAALSLANGGSCQAEAPFNVIEPLRKLVTTERCAGARFVNPSCVVYGTNAILEVGVRGDFVSENVKWSVISGFGRIDATNGLRAIVTPEATNGEIVVEARFNGDPIQPRFKLPIVSPRVVTLKAIVINPPEVMDLADAGEWPEGDIPWTTEDIENRVSMANEIFSQVGIMFNLVCVSNVSDKTEYWNLKTSELVTDPTGDYEKIHRQVLDMLDQYGGAEYVSLYFVGTFSEENVAAFRFLSGIFLTRTSGAATLAHELGHYLGLEDCYSYHSCTNGGFAFLTSAYSPVSASDFSDRKYDWGEETGRGFYEATDTTESLMHKLLMYGITDGEGEDIPGDTMVSLDMSNISNAIPAKVGAKHILPKTPAEGTPR